MEIKIIDYLHLYLGCECQSNIQYAYVGGGGSNQGALYADEVDEDTIGHIISALKRKEKDQAGGWNDHDHIYCKLILRPLSSMTEEEAKEYARIKGYTVMDNFRFIEKGFEFDHGGATTFLCLVPPYGNTHTPEQFIYLLSIGMDLFNLIPAGLAIDRVTTLKH